MILFGGGVINILPVQEKFYSVGCIENLEAFAVSLTDYTDQVVALVNQERANYGLAPVQCFDTLNDIAQIRAEKQDVAIVSKSGIITGLNAETARITVYNEDYDAVIL